MRKLTALIVLAVATTFSGCATVAGTATGIPMGAIDAPAETYRHNREAFDDYPILHGLNVLVMVPVGAVTGPVLGFGKGIALDVQCVLGHQRYENVFFTYDNPSIWRPYTIQWETLRR